MVSQCPCPVERIYEVLDRREYKERKESAECIIEERLLRWTGEEGAELKIKREITCYYNAECEDNDEECEEESVEEFVVGVDGRVAFTSINYGSELTDEVTLDAERAERVRRMILQARTWDDFHKAWKVVSEYIDGAEVRAELGE
jgi:hypothetical protein